MADESKIQEIVSAYPFKRGTTLSHTSLNQICEGLGNVTDGIGTKQDVISDLGTIRSGAALGATAVQPEALTDYYTKDETDGKLSTKQNALTQGDNIQIVNNVISATDTKYVAGDFDIKDLSDKTDLRTKWNNKQDALTAGSYIEISANTISVVGLDSDKYPITTWNNNNDAEIDPNVYNIWNNGVYPTQLTLKTPLNDKIVNEYIIRFTIPSTVLNYSLTFTNELKWADNNIPVWEAGCTYEISIIDGYAVFLKYF